MTGRELLRLQAVLHAIPRPEGHARAEHLLERVGLTDAADRRVGTYSGGMRRRLDLAASLIVSPPVLFLDEPTTGLDPRGRLAMWDIIGDLVADGTNVLLTTQYLEEADQLANQIVVVDMGRVIAKGTADELKTQIGGERIEITVTPGSDLAAATEALRSYSAGELQVNVEHRHIIMPVINGAQLIAGIVRDLDAARIGLDDLALRRPTLDDVFLTLTGRAATEAEQLADKKDVEPMVRSAR
jgi:ABC-2 type transport system ATP-binding protein